MKVMVITSQLPPDIGGTSVYSAEISRGLERAGHEVTVVIRDRDPEEFAPLGLREVLSVDTKRGLFKPLRQRRAQREILGWIRERGIEVVLFGYTVVGFGDLYGCLERAGVPYVATIHGFNRSDLATPGAIAKKRRKWGLRGAARVIACTRWLAETITPLAGRPVDFVHYGIDAGIEAAASAEDVAKQRAALGLEGRKVVLGLGRFVPRKNFDGLLRAFAQVAEDDPELRLVLVGGGARRGRCGRWRRTWGWRRRWGGCRRSRRRRWGCITSSRTCS